MRWHNQEVTCVFSSLFLLTGDCLAFTSEISHRTINDDLSRNDPEVGRSSTTRSRVTIITYPSGRTRMRGPFLERELLVPRIALFAQVKVLRGVAPVLW